jgi:antitoxin (DNA-binding transcriptional repressor) of toxin-antitoxin stability system
LSHSTRPTSGNAEAAVGVEGKWGGLEFDVASGGGTGRKTTAQSDVSIAIDKVATSSYLVIMRSVGIKLLKNKLSEYIRLAAGGETVLVTDRDRVVAELGPPAPARSPLVSDALLLDAVRQGWIRPPLSRGTELPARKPVMRLSEILQDLQQDRADR